MTDAAAPTTTMTVDRSGVARSRRLGLALAAAIVIGDQLIKYAMIAAIDLEARGTIGIEITSFFRLVYAENRGVSMGLLTAGSPAQVWALVALTVAISVGVVFWMWREHARGDILALALVLGGAIGNIIDRVRLGYVVDYADLHIGSFSPFFVFNLADASITIGVVLLVIRALVGEGKARVQDRRATASANAPPGERDI